jgi:hypothetical protein
MLGLEAGTGDGAERLLLQKLLAPGLDDIGPDSTAPLAAWKEHRINNVGRLVETAAMSLTASGIEANPVPGRVLFPILERGSLEDDETLQAAWAALLASASASPDEILPAFAHILAELSPDEARLLNRIYRVHEVAEAARLHPGGSIPSKLDPRMDLTYDTLRDWANLSEFRYAMLLQNLQRLDLIMQGANNMPDGSQGRNWNLTILGKGLMMACSPMEKKAQS